MKKNLCVFIFLSCNIFILHSDILSMGIRKEKTKSLQSDLKKFIQAILKNNVEEYTRLTEDDEKKGDGFYRELIEKQQVSISERLKNKDKKIQMLFNNVCNKNNKKQLEKIIIESKPILEYAITDLICNYNKENNGNNEKKKSVIIINKFPSIRRCIFDKSQIIKRRMRLDNKFKDFINALKKEKYSCFDSDCFIGDSHEPRPLRQQSILNRVIAAFNFTMKRVSGF